MSEKRRNIIDYVVACVNDFSDAHQMDSVAGFEYLCQYGGVSFLERNYDIEHAYSIDTSVSHVSEACRKCGGTL